MNGVVNYLIGSINDFEGEMQEQNLNESQQVQEWIDEDDLMQDENGLDTDSSIQLSDEDIQQLYEDCQEGDCDDDELFEG